MATNYGYGEDVDGLFDQADEQDMLDQEFARASQDDELDKQFKQADEQDKIGEWERIGRKTKANVEEQAGGIITSVARGIQKPTTFLDRVRAANQEAIPKSFAPAELARAATGLLNLVPQVVIGAPIEEAAQGAFEALPQETQGAAVAESEKIGEGMYNKGKEELERVGDYGIARPTSLLDEPYQALKYYGAPALESVGSNMALTMMSAYLTRGRLKPGSTMGDALTNRGIKVNPDVTSQVVGLSTMGAGVFGQEYEKVYQATGSHEQAVDQASVRMFNEVVPEIIPLGIAMKTMAPFLTKAVRNAGGFTKAVAQLSEGVMSEGLSEVVTEAFNAYYDYAKLGKEVDYDQLKQRFTDAFLVGALMGGTMNIPGAAGELLKGPGDDSMDATLENWRSNPRINDLDQNPNAGGLNLLTGGRIYTDPAGTAYTNPADIPGMNQGGAVNQGIDERQAPGGPSVGPMPPPGAPPDEPPPGGAGGTEMIPLNLEQAPEYVEGPEGQKLDPLNLDQGGAPPDDQPPPGAPPAADQELGDEDYDKLIDAEFGAEETPGADPRDDPNWDPFAPENITGPRPGDTFGGILAGQADNPPDDDDDDGYADLDRQLADIKDEKELNEFIDRIHEADDTELKRMRGELPEQREAYNKKRAEALAQNKPVNKTPQQDENPAADNLLKTIAKRGGLNIDTWKGEGSYFTEAAKDKATNNMVVGRPLFSNHESSMSPDRLAEHLNQFGADWVPEQYLDNGILTANTVLDLVADALSDPDAFGLQEYHTSKELYDRIERSKGDMYQRWQHLQEKRSKGDLLGEDVEHRNKLAEAQRLKDEQRQGGKGEVVPPEAGEGGLFSGGQLAPDLFPGTTLTGSSEIDQAAHEAATSPTNDLPLPTKKQRREGDYKKGYVSQLKGFDVLVENPAGSTREGKRDGKAWSHKMVDHYGYVEGTKGADNDGLDIFLGPEAGTEKPRVAIVNQRNPKTGKFDEHKVIYGYQEGKAEETYLRNYSPDFKDSGVFAGLTEITHDEFLDFIKNGDLKKPYGDTFAKEMEDESDRISREEAGAGREQVSERGELLQGEGREQPSPGAGDQAGGGEGRGLVEPGQVPGQVTPEAEKAGQEVATPAAPAAEPRADTLKAIQQAKAGDTIEGERVGDVDNAEALMAEAGFRRTEATTRPAFAQLGTFFTSPDRTVAASVVEQGGKVKINFYKPSPEHTAASMTAKQSKLDLSTDQGRLESKLMFEIESVGLAGTQDYEADETLDAERALKSNGWSQLSDGSWLSPSYMFDGRFHIATVTKKSGSPTLIRISRPNEEQTEEITSEQRKSDYPAWYNTAWVNDALDYFLSRPNTEPMPPGVADALGADTEKNYVKTEKTFSKSADAVQAFRNKLAPAGLWQTGKNLFSSLSREKNGPVGFRDWAKAARTLLNKGRSAAVRENAKQDKEAPVLWKRTAETKTTTGPKRQSMKKLIDEGLDIKRWWDDLRKNNKEKPTAGEDLWKILNNEASRTKLFKPVPADDATPGVQRYYDALRGELTTLLDLTEAFVFEGRNQTADVIHEIDDNQKFADKLVDYAEQYAQMMLKFSHALSGASTVSQAEALLSEFIETSHFASKGGWELLRPNEDTADTPLVRIPSDRLGNERIIYPWQASNYRLKNLLKSRHPIHPGPRQMLAEHLKHESSTKDPFERKRLSRARFDDFTRTAENSVRDGDKTIKEFQEEFGFNPSRMMGEYVTGSEQQAHLNASWDAFADLADILGIPRKAIGFGRRLNFLVGKVGQGGRHAAHFNLAHMTEQGPVSLINVTKTKGDGSVAHEWGHALDLMFMREDGTHEKVFDVIQKILTQTYDISVVEKAIDDGVNGRRWITQQGRTGKKGGVANTTALVHWILRNKKATDYKTQADMLGKSYWGNDKELFARAFESWIFDKLLERKIDNPYLVNDWVSDGRLNKDAGYRGNPYPSGAERSLFNETFDALVKAIEYKDGKYVISSIKFTEALPKEIRDFDKEVEALIATIPDKIAQRDKEQDEKNRAAYKRIAEEQKRIREQREEQTRKVDAEREKAELEELRVAQEQAAAELALDEEKRRAEEAQRMLSMSNGDVANNVEDDQELSDSEYDSLVDQAFNEIDEQRQEEPDKPLINAPAAASQDVNQTTLPQVKPETPGVSDKAQALIDAAARDGVTGIDHILAQLANIGGKKPQGSTVPKPPKGPDEAPTEAKPRSPAPPRELPPGLSKAEYERIAPAFDAMLEAYRMQGKTLADMVKTIAENGKQAGPYLRHWLKVTKPTARLATKEGNNDPRDVLDPAGSGAGPAGGDVDTGAKAQDDLGVPDQAGGGAGTPGGRAGAAEGGGGRAGLPAKPDTGLQPADAGLTGGRADSDANGLPVGQPGDGQGASAAATAAERAGAQGQGNAAEVSGGDAARSSTDHNESGIGSERQVDYIPGSDHANDKVLIPSNMREAIISFLNVLKTKVKGLDRYVYERLGYTSKEFYKDAFMALQIDAIAAAIHAVEQRNQGIIIADQTGLGKGRQAAAMIKYALRHGMVPVFVSAKANLFTDMWGDLNDITEKKKGEVWADTGVKPFIFNDEGGFVTETTELTEGSESVNRYKQTATSRRAGMQALKRGVMPAGSNTLFLTYSQIDKAGIQREALDAMSKSGLKPLFIFDESHLGAGERTDRNADGTERTKGAGFLFDLITDHPVVYLSATYAKRPENMLFYWRTDLVNAVEKIEDLEVAINRGGEALQAVVASMLARSGQLWRRERSFANVDFNVKIFKNYRAKHEAQANKLTEQYRNLVDLDESSGSEIKNFKHEDMVRLLRANDPEGVLTGVKDHEIKSYHHPFSAVVHTYVRQFMASMKVDDVVDEVLRLRNLPEKEKVVVAFETTMGTFLSDQISSGHSKIGDEWKGDYRSVLRAALKKSTLVSFKKIRTDDKVYVDVPLSMFSQSFQDDYAHQEQLIDAMDVKDLEPFYIDMIKHRLQEKGVKVGEITGRTLEMDYSEGGNGKIKRKPGSDKRNRRKTIDGFNRGDIDVIILNSAGATGLSLHADKRFKDKSKRHLLVAQPMGDINTLVQVFGRVNRTGQVVSPAITMMGVDLPAEMRPLAMVMKKMKSLSANTSANTESETELKGVVDIFNKYGNEIVAQFLRTHHDVDYSSLTRMTAAEAQTNTDFAMKFMGKLQLLEVADQEYAWDVIGRNYLSYIKMLDDAGQNELRTQVKEIDARIIDNRMLVAGKDVDSIFAGDAIVHKVSVKREGRQPKGADVIEEATNNLNGQHPSRHLQEIWNRMLQFDTFRTDAAAKLAQLQAIPDAQRKSKERRQIRLLETRIAERTAHVQEIQEAMFRYQIGKTFKIQIGIDEMVGTVVNISNDVDAKTKGDSMAPYRTEVKFRVNNVGDNITVSLSTLMNSSMIQEEIPVNGIPGAAKIFDDTYSSDIREVRYIVTGNMVAGFSKETGKIVSFQAGNGKFYLGIMLPKSYMNMDFTKSGFVFRTAEDSIKYLKAVGKSNLPEATIMRNDGIGWWVGSSIRGEPPEKITVSLKSDGSYQFTWPTPFTGVAMGFEHAINQIAGARELMNDAIGPTPRQMQSSYTVNIRSEKQAEAVIEMMTKRYGTTAVSHPVAVTLAERVTGKPAWKTNYSFDGTADDMSLAWTPADQTKAAQESDKTALDELPTFSRMHQVDLGFEAEEPGEAGPPPKDGKATARSRKIEAAMRKHSGYTLEDGSILEVPAPAGMSTMLKVVKRLFKRDVVFIYVPNNAGLTFSGVILPSDPSHIYININSTHPYKNVIGHELLHTLRIEYPKLYNELVRRVADYRKKGSLADYANLLEAAGEREEKLEPQPLFEEMMADLVGEVMADPVFLRSLARYDGTFFRNVMNALSEIISRFIGKLRQSGMASGRFFESVAEVHAEIRGALREFVADHQAFMGPVEEEVKQAAPEAQVPIAQTVDAETANQPVYMREANNQLRNMPNPRNAWNRRADRIMERVDYHTRWYEALGDLPLRVAYLKRRYLALGLVGNAEKISQQIRAGFKLSTPADREAAYNYLTTRGANPAMISNPELRRFAVALKERIDQIGQRLVRAGMISEESYEAYRDSYLPRLYLKYLMEDDAWKALGGGKRASTMGYTKLRSDIPEDVRAVILGEVKDPSFLASVAISRSLRDLAILDFLDDIAQNQAWVHPNTVVEWGNLRVSLFWLRDEAARLRKQARIMENREDAARAVEVAEIMETLADENTRPPGEIDLSDYRQVPTSAQFGRLRGMWVRKEIHNDLTGVSGYNQAQTGVESFLGYGGWGTKINQWWKISKVAMNPPTQVRNFISNLVMLNISGVPWAKIVKNLPSAFSAIVQSEYPALARTLGLHTLRNPQASRAWETAKKYGVTQSTFSNNELAQVHRALTELKREAATTNWQRGMYGARGLIEMLAEGAGHIYQVMEAVGKTVKIMHEMEQGLEPGDAALEAHKWLFDYSLVPRTVGYLRNVPFGVPFITFYYKVAPRLVEGVVRNPVKIAAYIAMPAIWSMVMALLNDVDDDDIEKLRMAYPDWIRKSGHVYLLPWRDEYGRWQVFDFSYFLPWTMFTTIGSDIASGDFKEAFKAAGVFGGPIPNIVSAIMTGIDPFTQKPVFNEYDPPKQQMIDMLNYMWSLAAPSVITDNGTLGKMMEAYGITTQAYDQEARPRGTETQALLRTFGINIYSIDPELSRISNMKSMRYEIDQIKMRMRKELSNPGLDPQSDKFARIQLDYMTLLDQRIAQLVKYGEESEVHPNLRTKPPEKAVNE